METTLGIVSRLYEFAWALLPYWWLLVPSRGYLAAIYLPRQLQPMQSMQSSFAKALGTSIFYVYLLQDFKAARLRCL
jgi:hypothetical protein